MNVFAALFITMLEFIKAFFKVFMPILIIVFILVLIKVLYRYFKYGKIEFDFLKKRNPTKFLDIILNMIKKIDSNALCINQEKLYSDIVLVHETGIYLLKVVKYQGILKGKRKDKTIKNRIKTDTIVDKDNPFYYLDLDKEKISAVIKNVKIKTILITNNSVNVSIDSVSKEEVLNLQNFYYAIQSNFKASKKYSKEEVLKISHIVENIN